MLKKFIPLNLNCFIIACYRDKFYFSKASFKQQYNNLTNVTL